MAKRGNVQTAIEYGAAWLVLSVVGALPLRQSIKLGAILGRFAFLFAGELRRTGEINLKLAFPEISLEERRKLLRGCFESLGRQLGLFSHFSSDPQTVMPVIEGRGIEHLVKAKTGDTGIILFTGHLGAWELTSFWTSLCGHPFSFLVRRIDNPRIEELVDGYRTSAGNKTLDKSAAARSMVKILRSREAIGLLFDLNALEDEAIFVDFFGVPASTNFMTAKLALRTGAALIPCFAPWDKQRQKFLVQMGPPVQVEHTGDDEEDVRTLTAQLSLLFEKQIRKYPEQWLWIHKRWKTRPKGEPPIY